MNAFKAKTQYSEYDKNSILSSEDDIIGRGQHPSISLPLAFKIYCDKARFTYSVFYVGRRKGERLNAISIGYTGWFHATVALHEGPDVNSAVLGSSVINTTTVDVKLPSGDVQLKGHRFWSSSNQSFTLPVGNGATPERFEWRRSHGNEVKALGGWGLGWKLIRMHDSKDVEEVAAVYSVDLCSPKLSGRFEFLGSGATKELGRDWVIMAVVSALSLGQKRRESGVLA